MKIVLFTDTYLPTVNGVARALGLLVEHARAAGHRVAIVTPPLPGPDAEGVEFQIRLPGFELPFYRELHACRPWLGREGVRRLEAFEPDVVHAATEAAVGWAGRRWALTHDVPLVTSYCTNFADYVSGYRMGFLEGAVWAYLRRFHGAAGCTVAPSRATLRELEDRGFHRSLRIWSRGVDSVGFNPAHRSPAVRQEMAPGAEVILLYVGRIAPEKKVGMLLDAFPAIRERAKRKVRLVLVGDGPALTELEARNVEGVRFTGYRRGALLAQSYASADAFVFPSDTETFGQVVTEAFASGLPVVAANRGGVTDLVQEGRTGFLFEPDDVDGLVEAALRVVDHPEIRWRMSAQARAAAESRSWDDVFRLLFRHYDQVSRNGHPTVTASSAEGPDERVILRTTTGNG